MGMGVLFVFVDDPMIYDWVHDARILTKGYGGDPVAYLVDQKLTKS